MILLLIVIILALSVFSLFLMHQLKISKRLHSDKVNKLKIVIFDLLEEQKKQSFKLRLSEDLRTKLSEARITIDENVMELQHDLFYLISKNN